MAELLNAMQMLRESVDGANTCWQAMISCVARSARRSSDRLDLASSPDKRSVPRVLDPPEPDWPKRPWQSSWGSAFPIAGTSVLTSIHARITEAGRHSGWRTKNVPSITCVAPGTRTKGSWISARRRAQEAGEAARVRGAIAETCNQSAREMLRPMSLHGPVRPL